MLATDVDFLLDKFVTRDYSSRKRPRKSASLHLRMLKKVACSTPWDRAAMEIGRRQIIYFAAEVLDEDPDPTMLAEPENDPEEAGTSAQAPPDMDADICWRFYPR
jgi:hypothetical protein